MRRSISEQLEGITRLPILLDTYPHPHLAQHSMLYLADVFLKGQNFQRQVYFLFVNDLTKSLSL